MFQRKEVSIFDFFSSRQYLSALYQLKKTKNSRISYRALARLWKLKDHTYLSHIILAKRPMSIHQARNLAIGIGLSPRETEYLETLVLFEKARTAAEKDLHFSRLKTLHPSCEPFRINKKKYSKIATELHHAILEMIQLHDFRNDPEWVRNRLIMKRSIQAIRCAIFDLIRLGLIQVENGVLMVANKNLSSEIGTDTSEIRKFYLEALDLGKMSFENDQTRQQWIRTCTVTIDTNELPLALEMIREFRKKFGNALQKKGNQTYQLNVHFFPLTQSLHD